MLLTSRKYSDILNKIENLWISFNNWIFSTWFYKQISRLPFYWLISLIIRFIVMRIIEIFALIDFIFFVFWFKFWCVERTKLHHLDGWIHTRKVTTQFRFIHWVMTFSFILHFIWNFILLKTFVIIWVICILFSIELYWNRYTKEPRWMNFEKNWDDF